jgi:uncharacterized membrane-anchored protein YhcB (DUF1043 family)
VVDIGLTVALVIGAVLVGFGIGYLALQAKVSQRHRVTELETALEASLDEMKDYKRDVFEQFGETADKFRALNRSYEDLHQQLAKSAVILCGDSAMPLLDAPREVDDTDDPIEATIVVAQTAEDDDQLDTNANTESDGDPADTSATEPSVSETVLSEITDSETTQEHDEETIVVSEEIPADPEALGSLTDDVDVPTLTEVQDLAGAQEDLTNPDQPTTGEDEVKRQAWQTR